MNQHNFPKIVKMTKKTSNKILEMADKTFYDKESPRSKREGAIDVLFKLGLFERVREMENELQLEGLAF